MYAATATSKTLRGIYNLSDHQRTSQEESLKCQNASEILFRTLGFRFYQVLLCFSKTIYLKLQLVWSIDDGEKILKNLEKTDFLNKNLSKLN